MNALQVGPWGALSFRTDLHGVVVGDLLVESVAGRRGNAVEWLCLCLACHQRKALRTTGALVQALKQGHGSSCLECQRELQKGRAVEIRQKNRELYLELYAHQGTLYGLQWDRSFEADLMGVFAKEFGPVVGELEPKSALTVAAMGGPNDQVVDRFLDAYIRPLRSEMFSDKDGTPLLALRWKCLGCDSLFSSGSACFGCVKAICSSCVAARTHECRVPGDAHPYPYDVMCSREGELYGRLKAVAFAAWQKSGKGRRTMSREAIEHAMDNAKVLSRDARWDKFLEARRDEEWA